MPRVLSVALVVVGVGLTALPVTLAVDRLAASGRRLPPRVTLPVVSAVLALFAAFAGLQLADAFDVLRVH